jgi:hypothetical protein
MPTPDANSLFGGWSSGCTVVGINCSITMDGAKTVTSTFNAAPQLRILGGGNYSLLPAAYTAAADKAVIQSRAVLFDNGDLILNRPISVFFMGGFDAAFGSNSGETVLKGRLLIRSGTVRVDGLVLR